MVLSSVNKQRLINSAWLQTQTLGRAGTAWLFLCRYLRVFDKRGLHPAVQTSHTPAPAASAAEALPDAPKPLLPWGIDGTSLSPTLASHTIFPFPPFFALNLLPTQGFKFCPVQPGLKFGSRESMTSLECGKRKEIGCTIPKPGVLKYCSLSPGWIPANPEDKGGKSHCKQGPTFYPHVL